jgi:hypothetical protein
MKQRLDDFLGLSVCLTGFGRLRLLGTGMAQQYLQAVDAILPPGVLDRLLAVYRGLPEGAACAAALAERILADAELGPVARNVILVWYCGTWSKLPDDWRSAEGVAATDETHVVSAAAYLAGLQWALVGGHPAGGMPQGYGAWASPPEVERR